MTQRSRSAQPARLGPGELRTLYDNALEIGLDAAHRKRRWGRAVEFAAWLDQDALASLEPEQAIRLYRASGGREASAFASVPIEELRDSLDFLLYDTIKLEGRFDECVNPDGAYKLPGAGKEFVSWLLCLRNPALLGVWNVTAERLLRRVGAFPESMNRGPIGIRYLDLLESLARLRQHIGLRDFIEVDIAAYLATRPPGRQPASSHSDCTERNDALA